MVMRRSSTGLGLGTLVTQHKSESKTSLSDSSTKGSNLKVGTTLGPELSPYTIVSPVAESPAREAEASRPTPIVGPSPLGAIVDSRPQEPPAPAPEVPSEPPAPRLPEPEVPVVESPPNLADSPQPHEPALPVVEQASGKLSDYVEPQPAVAETPAIASRELREESDSIHSGPELANKAYGIPAARVEQPQPKPVSIPIPEPAPVAIQVPEQQLPPPTKVVSDVRELPLLGPTVIAAPSDDHSPWASVISRNDNLSSQPSLAPRTPPYHPRSLSPKQSRASFAGTVFESVNGSQQSIPRQISNKPSKASLAPSYSWNPKPDPQPKPTPQVVDHGNNGDARTISSTRYSL